MGTIIRVGDHHGDTQSIEVFGRHRDADQAPRGRGHEVDHVCVGVLGGDDQVAFVLAVLIVDDNNRSAPRQVGHGIWYRVEVDDARRVCIHLIVASLKTGSPGKSVFENSIDVLAEYVYFNIDDVSEMSQGCRYMVDCERHQHHGEIRLVHVNNRETDAV